MLFSFMQVKGDEAFEIECHRAAQEAGAATAIVNVGVSRADNLVPLRINARLGEVRSLETNLGARVVQVFVDPQHFVLITMDFS